MNADWLLARSAVRGHRGSFIGLFIIVVLAATLLIATGSWLEAGLRAPLGATGAGRLLTRLATTFAGSSVVIVLMMAAMTFGVALRSRRREFALLRTIGATTHQIRRQMSFEVLLVFGAALPIAIVPGLVAARAVAPLLARAGLIPADFVVGVSVLSVFGSAVLLLPTGLIAARLAARRLLLLSPAAAVGSSSHEPAGVGRGRKIAAAATGITGLLSAGTPFALPGVIGSAAGTTSVFLLVASAALAGPWLINVAARLGLSRAFSQRSSVMLLTLMNARGFSRRLATAIVPLSLLLALGTVQAGINSAVGAATQEQFRAGLSADLVLRSQAPFGDKETETVADTPGVQAVGGTTLMSAEARIDQEDEIGQALLGDLLWEPATIRSLPSPSQDLLLDPLLSAGSLADLNQPGTIAVSREVLLGSGNGLGGTVDLRAGGHNAALTIVAVYERGLGYGDYLVAAAADEFAVSAPHTLLINVAPGEQAEVQAALAGQSLSVLSPEQFSQQAAAGSASTQRLSSLLTLALLAFVGLAALNSLAMQTTSRAAEFRLLRTVGATRGQTLRLVGLEAVFVVVAALLLGTTAALPSLAGAGFGLVGHLGGAIDLATYGGLALTVTVLGLGTMLGAGWRARSRP